MTPAPTASLAARGTFARDLAWVAVPILLFAFVLTRLWFDAPVWDDYDTVLGLLIHAGDLHDPRQWLAMLFGQHNEHRIVTTRLAVLALSQLGPIDFRVLMAIGNLALAGAFAFIWAEFRGRVPSPAFGVAAFLMFQWSYYEASLMGSAALPHLGVVFFSFGCLYCAMHGGRASAVIAAVLGLLAAGSQANGLFALPLAAAGSAFMGRRSRAALFAVLALAAWAAYFHGYHRPEGHPSPLLALSMPVETAELFLVIAGGFFHRVMVSLAIGVIVVAGLAWVAWKGSWRRRPVAALWVLYLFATAGAAAMGRIGFGLWQAPRYAIDSTCLLVILWLALCELAGAPSRRTMMAALAVSVAFGIVVSFAAWPDGIRESTLRGKMLREAVRALPDVPVDRYGGPFYPQRERAEQVLAISARRGYYEPPKQIVHGSRVAAADGVSPAMPSVGHIDGVAVSGPRMSVTGWTDVTALHPGRTIHVVSSPPFRAAAPVAIVDRADVVMGLGDTGLLYSGFRLELDYASEAEARAAAGGLCAWVEAPGQPPDRLAALQDRCGGP